MTPIYSKFEVYVPGCFKSQEVLAVITWRVAFYCSQRRQHKGKQKLLITVTWMSDNQRDQKTEEFLYSTLSEQT